MKKYAIWIILGVIILWFISGYNSLVGSRETVNKAWANVENQYQRRADLIPNLVNTVKGAAEFEKSTLEAVMEARSKATSIRIDPDNMTPEKLQEYQRAQAQVGGALSRLLAVAENYPQLRAVESFRDLQSQLEGTENRINEERRKYNEAAQAYNTSRAKFPRMFVANLFGFKDRPYFEADKGTEKAPGCEILMDASDSFKESERKLILAAIKEAEKNTSGEIRLFIEDKCGENVLDRAAFIFTELGMNETKEHNGVLFYLAMHSHQFAILGDSGINSKVEKDFWHAIKMEMQNHFTEGKFEKGLSIGIKMAGEALKKYFPYRADDKNELSNEIVFGKKR